MGPHAFVDETMRGGYLMAAALLPPAELPHARKATKKLIMPGQRRLHFNNERDSRRRRIISTVRELRPQILLYDASVYRKTRTARRACLRGLVDDLTSLGGRRLVIENVVDAVEDDRRVVFERLQWAGSDGRLDYVHLRASEECLLSVPDAVAWCWTRKGPWQGLVADLVTKVSTV